MWDDAERLKIVLKCTIFPILVGVICYPCARALQSERTVDAMQLSAFVYIFGLIVGSCGTVAMILIYQRIKELRRKHAEEIANGKRFE